MMKEKAIIKPQSILQPVISVIIPVYNVEQFLDQCVASVRNQTYKNLEIILIDDGSTDKSGAICDKHAGLDARIKVLHQENKGASSARNSGLRICKGAYIGFVDSDDWLEPQMYERLAEAIERRDTIGVSMCRYFMNYDSEEKEILNRRKVPQGIIPIEQMLYYIYRRDRYKGVTSYLWTKLFRRGVFGYDSGDERIQFCESMKVGEDVLFAAECYIKMEEAVYIDEALYHYRQRQNSAMHSYDMRLQTGGSCEAYERVIGIFEKRAPGRVLRYVKRFYVYHASLLLQMAIEKKKTELIDEYRRKTWKYIGSYILTNLDHPFRIFDILKLLITCSGRKR